MNVEMIDIQNFVPFKRWFAQRCLDRPRQRLETAVLLAITSADAVQDSLIVVVLSRAPVVKGFTDQTQDVVDVLFL
jgi:hypothetical protein